MNTHETITALSPIIIAIIGSVTAVAIANINRKPPRSNRRNGK